MYRIIAVSNRALCVGDFEDRLRTIASFGTDIILREKDMPREEYARLLGRVGGEHIIPHTFTDEAKRFGRVHLPLAIMRAEHSKVRGMSVGVSVHSADEAREAQTLGAAYVTAGHVFETDCKKGLPGRGVEFVRAVKNAVDIPVYAIGGITPQNAASVIDAGADGICIMSALMQCPDVGEYLARFMRQ